jgi:hypothetical protein
VYSKFGRTTRTGQSYLGGQRIWLLGVVDRLASQDVTGKFRINAIPNPVSGIEVVGVPSNLGICLLSSAIMDFEEILLSRGLKINWQYDSSIK